MCTIAAVNFQKSDFLWLSVLEVKGQQAQRPLMVANDSTATVFWNRGSGGRFCLAACSKEHWTAEISFPTLG